MKKYFLLLFFYSWIFHANTIQVGNKYPVKSIKQALSLVKQGDTIIVSKGTYKEGTIVIDKKIVLLGMNYPVLDGQKKYEVVAIQADGVILKGFKIIRSKVSSVDDTAAVKIYDSNFVQIENNVLDDNFFGVYVQNGKNCIVKNNKLRAYGNNEQRLGNGVHCWKSEYIQIIGNKIEGHRDGIYLEFVTNSIVWRNISKNNIRYGLHFMFSHQNSYITNYLKNNGAGVAVMFTHDVIMINNTFEENWGSSSYGLLLKEITDSYVLNNNFIKNTTGIYMEGSNRIVMKKNNFRNNGWAIRIQASCSDNVVSKNNFIGNTFDMGTNGSLVLNIFDSNYWDKYEGYDLNKDNIGDVPYHPLSLFSVLTEKTPSSMILYRSFMITLLDKSEKVLPSITPDNFVDKTPLMKSLSL